MIFRLLFLLLPFVPASVMATPEAFPPTPPGRSEIKTLPAGVLLRATAAGSYFDRSDDLFRPLFNYISRQGISMTTPVEATVEPGEPATMSFWVAESQRTRVAGSRDRVEVVEVPARTVASIGVRGSYSAENFRAARERLEAWLQTQADVVPAGPAYAVYWDGPFVPGLFKRAEVHIPVRPRSSFPADRPLSLR
jgi:effector-binding domain-containing protein